MPTIPAEIILSANAAKIFNEDMIAILEQSSGDQQIAQFNKALDAHLAALASAMGGIDNLLTVLENPVD
jgi:hypothetical protein